MADSHPITALVPVIVVFGVLLAVLWWASHAYLEGRANPNAAGAAIRNDNAVVLKRSPGGSFRTPGTINGKRVQFLVDTGASLVALPGETAQRLDLERGRRTTLRTAGGPTTGYLTRLDRVSVGSITVANVRAAVVPRLSGHALLGTSFLRYVNMTFDADTLILR